MKVTSAILSTMSGKLAGAVASKARGGIQYFRTLVQPSNPRTYLQRQVRAALSSIAGAWRSTLSGSQRAAWLAIAKTGESGIDRYTAANTLLLQGGTARQDDAPESADLAWLALPTPDQFTITLGDPTQLALAASGASYGANGEKISFYIQSRVQPDSRQFPVGNMQYAGTFTIAGTAHPTVTLSDFTHPDLAGLAGGDNVQVDVVKFKADGTVSQRIGTLVTAT